MIVKCNVLNPVKYSLNNGCNLNGYNGIFTINEIEIKLVLTTAHVLYHLLLRNYIQNN